MSGNTFGTIFKITTFGESHGEALGVVIDGIPSGISIDEEYIRHELKRRRPGHGKASTPRNEADDFKIISGIFEGKATGTPLTIIIENTNQQSKDYADIKDKYRPGHADYTYNKKYGIRDYRGGGRASGRETVARVAAGAIAKLILKKHNIKIHGTIIELGNIKAENIDFEKAEQNEFRFADENKLDEVEKAIEKAKLEKDSLGGIVEIRISNSPAGLGEPVFDKLDAELAKAIMSIGSIKGIEIGKGFDSSKLTGSQNNDQMNESGFITNNAGGIIGGISTGQEIVIRCAVKPTPTIGIEQKTVDANNNPVTIQVGGRHDICIAPRLIPIAEAMAAMVICDMLFRQNCRNINE